MLNKENAENRPWIRSVDVNNREASKYIEIPGAISFFSVIKPIASNIISWLFSSPLGFQTRDHPL